MQIQWNPDLKAYGPNNFEDLHWYAARTRANHEKRVPKRMAYRNIQHLIPLCTSLPRWKDRKAYLSMRMFPCLFVRFRVSECLRVFQVPGVVGSVTTGSQPIPLVDQIQAIQSCMDPESSIAPHRYPTVGNPARVLS
jgi:Transcription termination factor nusG